MRIFKAACNLKLSSPVTADSAGQAAGISLTSRHRAALRRHRGALNTLLQSIHLLQLSGFEVQSALKLFAGSMAPIPEATA